ncbi:undecaprenyl phosphate translocase family protein [Sedimentibacter sp.]|uniref:DUF368 domain-containing protein n=1 Tax=Sedimentibacter sp. TaxID=1960295 RepID=UPI00289B4AD3|nr:DUF368 domain-containing protein [Sedimentibacter sp.]
MNFFSRFLKGLIIGAGAIAPGVSGGALAVIFGLYDKMTFFIANFTYKFKENVKFFIPVGIGGALGVLLFSRIIELLFTYHEVEVRYAFIGLMLGTIPSVIKEANKKGFKPEYLIPLAITFISTLVLTFLEESASGLNSLSNPSSINIIIYGLIIGFGTIIPGISASIILMYIGAYEFVISAISNLSVVYIFYLGIGFVISILLFSKLISMLFKRCYGVTFYAILGLVLGSIISIFPGFSFTSGYIFNSVLLIACFLLSYNISRLTG